MSMDMKNSDRSLKRGSSRNLQKDSSSGLRSICSNVPLQRVCFRVLVEQIRLGWVMKANKQARAASHVGFDKRLSPRLSDAAKAMGLSLFALSVRQADEDLTTGRFISLPHLINPADFLLPRVSGQLQSNLLRSINRLFVLRLKLPLFKPDT